MVTAFPLSNILQISQLRFNQKFELEIFTIRVTLYLNIGEIPLPLVSSLTVLLQPVLSDFKNSLWHKVASGR